MNTRKLLARLGPKTPQLIRTALTNGSDALTPQDIAAALGFVKVRPGRDLYEFLWVPNRASNPVLRNELEMKMANALMDEQRRREMAGLTKFPDPPATLCVTPDGRKSVLRFCIKVARCCLHEMVHRNDCPDCKGFGEVFIKAAGSGLVSKPCEKCTGSGTVPVGWLRRSRMMGVRNTTFKECVEQPYGWLLGYMREQEAQAAHEHWKAMCER